MTEYMPYTEYVFKLHATNERGKGAESPLAQVMTKGNNYFLLIFCYPFPNVVVLI